MRSEKLSDPFDWGSDVNRSAFQEDHLCSGGEVMEEAGAEFS